MGVVLCKFERTCENDPTVEFECRAHWIALNSLAWGKAESEGLRNLLRYVSTDEVAEGDALVNRIDAEVTKVNLRNGGSGMLLDTQTMLEQEARVQGRIQGREEDRAEGREKGRAEGEGRYGRLVALLLEQDRLDDIRRANVDPDLRERLFREFGL